jgi:hypothetical protein
MRRKQSLKVIPETLPAPIVRTAGTANAIVGTNRRRSLEGLLAHLGSLPKKSEPDKQLPMKRHPRFFKRRVGYHPKTLGSTSALVIHEDTTWVSQGKPPSFPHDTRWLWHSANASVDGPQFMHHGALSMGPSWGGEGRQIGANPFSRGQVGRRQASPHHHLGLRIHPFQHTGFASHCRNSAARRPGATGI